MNDLSKKLEDSRSMNKSSSITKVGTKDDECYTIDQEIQKMKKELEKLEAKRKNIKKGVKAKTK